MRTYFNIGSTELTSHQSHSMISTHGIHDRTAFLGTVQRERYLAAISTAHVHTTAVNRSGESSVSALDVFEYRF